MADPTELPGADPHGRRIGRYEIIRGVATGGMGRVWQARFRGEHGFEKLVAVKTMLPEVAADEQLRKMFLDEARICARLAHANVAPILDVGEHEELPYIVFEWVEGSSLRDICVSAELREVPVPIGATLRALADVCGGLHAAHELTDVDGRPLGVVHRDVTPGNILVSPKGFAKLIDFGLAKAKDRLAAETRTGIVKGTPQYMAPEQARGDTIDRRTDVWGVGAVLYRAFAGRPPFRNDLELEAFVLGESTLAPLPGRVPAAVRAIVERAMSRDPARRHASADDLRVALEDVLPSVAGKPTIAELFSRHDSSAPPAGATSEAPTAAHGRASTPPARELHRRPPRLLLELGRGGMGVVYLVLAQGPAGFTKLKVVKRLRPELADDPRALRMFLDEARLAARLLHPNIVQTNEVAFDGKRCSLEMEYLEGQPYDALVRRAAATGRATPLSLTLWILTQALAGLHHAHELRDAEGQPLRVVHRDVSPHNLFVTYDGNVKLLDFGIAKAADSQRETTVGVVKGKVTYMAPEQAARRPVDRRADVFSVGVMLWEALAGARLWAGLDDFEIFGRLQRETIPSPRTVNADVAPQLEAICLRAVAADPGERFASAAELQGALEAHLEASGARVGPKAVATLMDDLFAEECTATRREIDTQIRRGDVELRTVDIPVLGQAPPLEPAPIATRPTKGDDGAAPTPNRALRRGIAAALTVAVLAGLGTVGLRAMRSTSRGRDATPTASSIPAPAVGKPGCSTNQECRLAHEGQAWICRKDRGTCVALESTECKVLAEPGDVENDRTLWLGSMYPTTGEKAEAGVVSERGVDLGRRDFAQITHGLPAAEPGAPPRPIGLVACNDATEALRPALHLAEDLGVPAVIGFGSSQEVVDLATQVFLPRHVMVVASANQSSLIAAIPHAEGTPRLVFRTILSSAFYQIPVSLIVPGIIEPRLRESGVTSDSSPMRVALVRPASTAGLSTADAIFGHLRYNGRSALENGELYRQFVFSELDHAASMVDELVAFRPHVVIFHGQGELVRPILEPIERAWKKSVPYRPTFVAAGSLAGDELFRFIGKDAGLRRRFFGVAPPATTMANARLTMRYNEIFAEHITPDDSPGAEYDGFYLLAYAAFAANREAPLGTDLAAGVGHLIPPGVTIAVGPTLILQGIDTLRRAKRFDLDGIMTRLDFDMTTGESTGDLSVTCVGVDDKGRAVESIDSGMRYDAATGALVGALRCP